MILYGDAAASGDPSTAIYGKDRGGDATDCGDYGPDPGVLADFQVDFLASFASDWIRGALQPFLF